MLLFVAAIASFMLIYVIIRICDKQPYVPDESFETETADAADQPPPATAATDQPPPAAAEKPTVEKIVIGDAEWSFGRLGFATVYVPFVLDTGVESGVLSVTIDGDRFTVLSSVEVNGTDVPKKQMSAGKYEVIVSGRARGVMKLSQSTDKAKFGMVLTFAGGVVGKDFDPPDTTAFPSAEARSNKLSAGPAERRGFTVRIPFTVKDRSGEALGLTWRAPPKTTYFENVRFEGVTIPSNATSANTVTMTLPPTGNSGVVEYQQSDTVEFTVWIQNGKEMSAVVVPKSSMADMRPPASPPPTVTPVADTGKDMVDLDAFPFAAREPIQSRVTAVNTRVLLDVATAERVSGSGYVVRLPFQLKFGEGEVPDGTKLSVTWQLDPATTQIRSILHGGKEIRPSLPTTAMDSFDTEASPGKYELVLDQPLGRRAITITLTYAGERTTVMLEGSASEVKGSGFVGAKVPVNFDGKPSIRFTDVHESAEERVVALYKGESGKEPDEQTTKFLIGKYFEWNGDMNRVSNVIASISAMVADTPDEETRAVQRAIASLESGASPGQAKDALKNWKEYETHRAMWRPDTNQAGYPGATALKRPWSETAIALSEGAKPTGVPAVAANAAVDFDAPVGDTHERLDRWMFL